MSVGDCLQVFMASAAGPLPVDATGEEGQAFGEGNLQNENSNL
jgi:hypothetical protein